MAALEDRRGLHAAMGMGVEALVVKHIEQKNAPRGNRLGATSTGFWMKAAGSMVGRSDQSPVVVSVPWPPATVLDVPLDEIVMLKKSDGHAPRQT